MTKKAHNAVEEGSEGERPRLLALAYACEPERGGEPEAGWIWSRMLARNGETWVITRANNKDVIESHVEPSRTGEHPVCVRGSAGMGPVLEAP